MELLLSRSSRTGDVFGGNKGRTTIGVKAPQGAWGSFTGSTLHGLRTSFSEWAIQASVPETLRKHVRGNAVGDAAQIAYERDTQVEARRKVMLDQADFLKGCK